MCNGGSLVTGFTLIGHVMVTWNSYHVMLDITIQFASRSGKKNNGLKLKTNKDFV